MFKWVVCYGMKFVSFRKEDSPWNGVFLLNKMAWGELWLNLYNFYIAKLPMGQAK